MGLFRRVTVRDGAREARISWGYYTAAALRTWAVSKSEGGQWSLSAGVDRCDPFKLKQAPLLLTVPRPGGFFCFPVQSITVGRDRLTARLGPPEY
jgi:hypothetical protein